MELRMNVDDAYMESLQKKLELDKGTEVVREALTILLWAAGERRNGRLILSANEDGSNVSRLALPSLERIQGKDASSQRATASFQLAR